MIGTPFGLVVAGQEHVLETTALAVFETEERFGCGFPLLMTEQLRYSALFFMGWRVLDPATPANDGDAFREFLANLEAFSFKDDAPTSFT